MTAPRTNRAHPSALPLSSCVIAMLATSLAACGQRPPRVDPAAPPAASATGGREAVNAGKCPARGVLDDFEDGDRQLTVADGRNGAWYTYVDEVGSTIEPQSPTLLPVNGGANGTGKALQITGSIAAQGIVYAGVGFGFVDPRAAYDAGCCDGVRFYAKARGCRGLVRVQVGDVNTSPDGGRCARCFDHFGKTLKVGEDWTAYEVAFREMTQEGWGEPQEAVDGTHLFELAFAVKDFACEYEVWVDEIELTGCSRPSAQRIGGAPHPE